MDGIWEPGADASESFGVRGAERSDGCPGNWREPPWPLFSRGREAGSPITGAPGTWWRVTRRSAGAMLAWDSVGQQNPAGAKGPCFIDAHVGGEGVWPVPEAGLDQPGRSVRSPADSAGGAARARRRVEGLIKL